MQEENNKITQEPEEQEIDLLELAMKLWDAKKFIIYWVLGGIVAGLIVAFSIPKEYTTTVVLAPEMQDSKSGSRGLSSLAAMAGINLGSGASSDALNPVIYPDIVSSVPFSVELFNVEVMTADKDNPEKFTVREYLEEETRGPWWGFLMGLPMKAVGATIGLIRGDDVEEDGEGKPVDPYRLSSDESLVVNALNHRISADVDNKTAIITVNVTMQDPLVATMLADTVVERLQEYVTNYRTNKARADLDYAQKLSDEAKADYHKAQQDYATYVDRNQNISLKSGQVEAARLQNEANLAFTLYNQTAQQLQMAKAKVQEMAPVYTVIQPATVPLKASKPSKIMVLIGFMFLAFVIAAGWILYGSDLVANIRNKRKEAAQPEVKISGTVKNEKSE